MNERLGVAIAFLLLAAPLSAETSVRRVAVQIVPPQPVAAITIRSGEQVTSVSVRGGQALVPSDLAPPWSLQLMRFEADVYSSADLDASRPWIIRELGVIRGRIERPPAKVPANYAWLLASSKSDEVRESEFTAASDGAFFLRVPAGVYHGVVIGPGHGTRIRSGIVVAPGRPTDVGTIELEPAAPVTVRVLDPARRAAVAGARVIWDPPAEMLNAQLSRRLFARRWSAVTDRYGMAEIRTVGPVPHSARWRVEADGFARALTTGVLLKEAARFAMPDVILKPEPTVVVRVKFPQDHGRELKGAGLVIGEQRDPSSRKWVALDRAPLREVEVSFRLDSYGRKRLWVENASGRMLVFENLEVKEPRTIVDLVLRPVELAGRVTRKETPIEGALVSLADPLDGTLFLAQTPSDSAGRFRLRSWANGKMKVYTIGPNRREGEATGRASADIDLTGRDEMWVDLELPGGGFSLAVVDSESGVPVRAQLDIRSRFAGGSGSMGRSETDARGKFDLTGYPEGTAKVSITAKGYRATTREVSISSDNREQVIRMEPVSPSSLRVVDSRGVAIPNATVLGGFENELDPQPFYDGSTDAEGRLQFDSPPPAGTMFYVAAAGHGLGITTLTDEREITVKLQPPSSSIVTLRQDNRPPEKVFLVMAAPPGGGMVPLTALDALAQANGFSLYQLCGSSPTGDVVLPQFLPAGRWDLSLARRGATSFAYEKVGTVQVPLTRSTVLAMGR